MQNEFGNEAKFFELYSEEKEDRYGDPIIRIWVVFEAKDNQLDPNKIASVIDPMHDYIKKYSMVWTGFQLFLS